MQLSTWPAILYHTKVLNFERNRVKTKNILLLVLWLTSITFILPINQFICILIYRALSFCIFLIRLRLLFSALHNILIKIQLLRLLFLSSIALLIGRIFECLRLLGLMLLLILSHVNVLNLFLWSFLFLSFIILNCHILFLIYFLSFCRAAVLRFLNLDNVWSREMMVNLILLSIQVLEQWYDLLLLLLVGIRVIEKWAKLIGNVFTGCQINDESAHNLINAEGERDEQSHQKSNLTPTGLNERWPTISPNEKGQTAKVISVRSPLKCHWN